MGLTAEQLEQRTRLIGASEIAGIAGLNRFSDPIKVWALKARGKDGEVDPLIPPDDPEVTSQRGIGHALEGAVVNLYAQDEECEGAVILPCHTLVHPVHDFIGATPDRLVYVDVEAASQGEANRGLEVKIVGRYMADEWDDGVPDDVVCQCQQNMSVTGLERWDVAALICGTDFQKFTIWRDDEVITALTDIATAFWEDFVIADVMPDIVDGKSAQKVLQAKWSKDNGEVIDAPADAAQLAARLREVQAWMKEGKKHAEALKAELCALTGDNRGMKSTWGSFSWATYRGGVQWKDVANAMADGLAEHLGIDRDVILSFGAEQCRSDSYRKAQFYPKKAKKKA